MKIILLLFILSFNLKAEEPCPVIGTNPATSLAIELSIPNCLSRSKLMLAEKGKFSPLCNACKEEFLAKSSADFKKTDDTKIPNERRKLVFNIALQEYKKTLTNSLVEIAKLRALESTNSKLKKSIKQCSFKKANDFAGCSKEIKDELNKSLSLLQNDLAGELAQLISPTIPKNRNTGILDRNSSKNLCPIPDKDILYHFNKTLEESFSAELIAEISRLKDQKITSFDDLAKILRAKGISNIDDIQSAMSSHPLFASYLNSPSQFITFIASIDPKTNVEFRKSLYSNTMGEKLDEKISHSCENAFQSFAKTICSEDFAKGDISFNPFSKKEYLESDISSENEEFSTSNSLIVKNLNAFKYCEIAKNSGKIDTEKSLKEITSTMENDLALTPFKDFKIQKYTKDINNLNDSLCNIKSGKDKCIEGTFTCTVYNRMMKPSESDSRLLASSNNEVNELLRSFIGGAPQDLPQETRVILTEAGILPKEDGSFVAQPDVPERQPGYFSGGTAVAKAEVKASAAPTAKVASRSSSNLAANEQAPYAMPASSTLPELPDFSKNNKELEDIENEIRRRLSALPEKPTTKTAAKKIAREASAKSGRNLSAQEEDYLANRMMASNYGTQGQNLAANEDPNSYSGPKREASVSDSDSAAEKYKKDGMNRALADMHGAKQSGGGASGAGPGRGPASESGDAANAKALTTVALNIAEDPKVTLSQSLAEKINKNDPETQLLQVLVKNKSPFILQVKSVNFKVTFDEQKQLRLLVDSGDPQEAAKLRPQLEIFFKRLGKL